MSKRIVYADGPNGLITILERLTEKRPKGFKETDGSIVLGVIPKELSVDIAHAKILIDDINEETREMENEFDPLPDGPEQPKCPTCNSFMSRQYLGSLKDTWSAGWYDCSKCGHSYFYDSETDRWYFYASCDAHMVIRRRDCFRYDELKRRIQANMGLFMAGEKDAREKVAHEWRGFVDAVWQMGVLTRFERHIMLLIIDGDVTDEKLRELEEQRRAYWEGIEYDENEETAP